MIKFFRRIRQKLLSESKFSQYILYAIGEIVLVVIGILIALQLNNWNEMQKNEISERKLLAQLRQENLLNLSDLKSDLAYRDTIDLTLYNFQQFLKTDIESEPEKLKNYLEAMLRATSYSPANNYLKKYISSNTGKNSKLATELIQLNSDHTFLESISNKALELKLTKFYDFLATDVDYETLEIHSFEKLKSLEFRNNVILLESIEEGVYDKFEDAYNQQQLVDSLISLELK